MIKSSHECDCGNIKLRVSRLNKAVRNETSHREKSIQEIETKLNQLIAEGTSKLPDDTSSKQLEEKLNELDKKIEEKFNLTKSMLDVEFTKSATFITSLSQNFDDKIKDINTDTSKRFLSQYYSLTELKNRIVALEGRQPIQHASFDR